MDAWTTHPTNGPTYHELKADHGIRDEKGRAVGGKAQIEQAYTYGPDGLGERVRADGFYLRIFASRNGQTYGAIPRATLHPTLEAAKAAGVKALAAQRARYAKKYARECPGHESLTGAAGLSVYCDGSCRR